VDLFNSSSKNFSSTTLAREKVIPLEKIPGREIQINNLKFPIQEM